MNNDVTEFNNNENESNADTTAQQDTKQSTEQPSEYNEQQEQKQDINGKTKSTYKFPPLAPVHRVGTVTMGFSLIAAGIIALISIFYPSFDVTLALKFAPIIFIFLGIEILIAHFFYKKARIKYDFLSGLVCFLLICGGLVLSAIPIAWNYFGPEANFMRNQYESNIENTVYESLKNNNEIDDVDVDIEPIGFISIGNKDYEIAIKNARVVLDIGFCKPFADENEFAQSCKKVLNIINPLGLNLQHVMFYFENDDVNYKLHLDNKFQYQLDTERLVNKVITTQYNEDTSDAAQTSVYTMEPIELY